MPPEPAGKDGLLHAKQIRQAAQRVRSIFAVSPLVKD